MSLMTGGQAVVKTLTALGARQGFGVPGESFLAVLDAFCDEPDFSFTGCRNEGGAAFMAEAWAKLTGEVGLCFVTRGPGATNAVTGMSHEYQLLAGKVAAAEKILSEYPAEPNIYNKKRLDDKH
jgi:acetolactate synthase-1/2/3 large subunit